LNKPDLSPESHSLAVTVRGSGRVAPFHLMFNAYWEPLTFDLPRLTPGVHDPWRLWIDTYRDAPDDIYDGLGPSVEGSSYTVQARSLVVLFALRGDAAPGSR
jgi:glycogen operon protein